MHLIEKMDNYFAVGGVVVTYHPEMSVLAKVLQAVSPQVERLLVVDNGSCESSRLTLRQEVEALPNCEIVCLPANRGVAHAQNRGLQWGMTWGCSHVLLLDQDSVPGPDMVDSLLQAYHVLKQRARRIAALGPCFVNSDYKNPSFFEQFGPLCLRRRFCRSKDSEEVIPADLLISSGALVAMPAFKDVGGMDESLFIDLVDTEWFLRAKSRGWHSYGVCAAHMEHKLGNSTLKLPLWGRARYIAFHDPGRYYYQFRNALWLCKSSHAPLVLKLSLLRRLIGRWILICAFGSSRIALVKNMWRGLKDGVQGKAGQEVSVGQTGEPKRGEKEV